MKYDCHLYVMSVDHVTSKATYGSDYKGKLENLTIFFSTSCRLYFEGNYGIRNRFSVYHVRFVDCGYYYDMQ